MVWWMMKKEICKACRNSRMKWSVFDELAWNSNGSVTCPTKRIHSVYSGTRFLMEKEEPPDWCLCKLEHEVLDQENV